MPPSASLARWGTTAAARERARGEQGSRGLWHPQPARAALLSAPRQRSVCHDTPTHGAWLHQMAIGRSIWGRTLRTRGAFVAVEDLTPPVLACLASDNRTMAKPCTWTSQGKPLAASTLQGCKPMCTSATTEPNMALPPTASSLRVAAASGSS
jgi:hypothetical protein